MIGTAALAGTCLPPALATWLSLAAGTCFSLAGLPAATPGPALPAPAQAPVQTGPGHLQAGIFLGQIYPSGRLYLERFTRLDHEPTDAPAADSILFVPLDADVASGFDLGREPVRARSLGRTDAVNPPATEGMLAPGSPCAPESYEPRPDAEYAGEPGSSFWNTAEYYATNEWFGCASESGLFLYEASHPPRHSHRVFAFADDLPVTGLDYSLAGTPRPMTERERAGLRDRRSTEADCTLEPRYLDDARVLIAFAVPDSGYTIRISSFVSACTSLAEEFLLDVMSGEGVLETFRAGRWRGNP